jgi:hypothetical protein
MEAVLHRTMRFDEPEMGVHRQILCHRDICVELNSCQMKASRLIQSVIYQLPSQTFTLSVGVNSNVIDEVRKLVYKEKPRRARVRVMGYYSEPESLALRDRNSFQRRRCASAIRARPAFVLGPVDSPPWNRHRRLPGTTLMMHGAPALVLA